MKAASLHRVTPRSDPGFTRVPAAGGGGFEYIGPSGGPVAAEDRARIDALSLPPAWQDVWVSADPDGHVQAVGVDADGRTQYRYHARWTNAAAATKFDRALALAHVLPTARRRNTERLRHADDAHERALAVAFRILDDAAPRIGSVTYLEQHGSRGLTTLLRRHASVDAGVVTLNFPGKEHRQDVLHMHDAELADIVTALVAGDPDARLLSFTNDGHEHGIAPAAVNDHIRAMTGGLFTAKDFRTVRGTIVAARQLARTGPSDRAVDRHRAEVAAVRAAAEALANTPAVARSSYIDPRVFAAYERGLVLDGSVAAERAISRLIVAEREAAEREPPAREAATP